MTTIEIKDASGKKAGDAELSASVFGIEPNVPVMHQVVRAQRASWRAGTSNTLTRSAAAARSRGARRAPAVPARAPSAPLSGLAAVPCSVRIRAATPSA